MFVTRRWTPLDQAGENMTNYFFIDKGECWVLLGLVCPHSIARPPTPSIRSLDRVENDRPDQILTKLMTDDSPSLRKEAQK